MTKGGNHRIRPGRADGHISGLDPESITALALARYIQICTKLRRRGSCEVVACLFFIALKLAKPNFRMLGWRETERDLSPSVLAWLVLHVFHSINLSPCTHHTFRLSAG